jgi:pyrroloquinoline quinone biosynthesis protein B
VLLNASPDIGRQVESFPALRPTARAVPITSVLLTDSELDHTLGLLLLREARGVRVHCTEPANAIMRNATCILPTLRAYCPVEWSAVLPGADVRLGNGLSYRAFDVPTSKGLRFAVPGADGKGRVVGYRITDERTNASLAFVPGVQDLTGQILAELDGCACLLVDGTCWSDDEMIRLGLAGKTSRDMGHVPVSGDGGSLDLLAPLPAGRKIYTHLNNTNPVLLEDSPERREAADRGMEIAYDGMDIVI